MSNQKLFVMRDLLHVKLCENWVSSRILFVVVVVVLLLLLLLLLFIASFVHCVKFGSPYLSWATATARDESQVCISHPPFVPHVVIIGKRMKQN